MKLALYIPEKEFQNNRILLDTNPPGMPDYHNERWCRLKKYLEERNIILNTHDCYYDLRSIDLIIIRDFTLDSLQFLLRHRVRPSKVILQLIEPPVILPRQWKYLKYYAQFFGRVLVWNTKVVNQHRNLGLLNYPQPVINEDHARLCRYKKNEFSVMIHSNKMSNIPGEMYSLRRKIIRYFQSREDHLLDLYGYGWNDDEAENPFHTSIYKGKVASVWETMSQYKFAFGLQNCCAPGYIARELFDPIMAGTVPIYLGAPDIKQFVPENCYIPFDQYGSLEDLVDYLKSIDNTPDYERYRKNGWDFMNSDRFRPFSVNKFCETLYGHVMELTHED